VSWRLGIRHETGYRYAADVTSSYNEARITPLTTDRQIVVTSMVRVDPTVKTFRYWDYWGTIVDAFDIHTPHKDLLITGESVVETTPPRALPDPPSWEELHGGAAKDEFAELLAPTSYVPVMVEAGRELAATGSPLDACIAAGEWVRERLRYEQGATTVSSSAADALAEGRGVCQDFAHLALALLRGAGIPARYVSGYLYPVEDGGAEEVQGQSHAWIEAWVGDWVPFDPTSGTTPGERHVVVARGRDYADVAPLKGIYHGGPSEALHVVVALTRLG
jgi:transglutaminase-like putative cysteine protease